MRIGRLLFGLILLALVASIPVFWSMVIGGVFFGAPFLPLIITIALGLIAFSLIFGGLKD